MSLGAFGGGAADADGVIERALEAFGAELGRQVREHRLRADESLKGAGLPTGMDHDMLAAVLQRCGIEMGPDELRRLEDGEAGVPDARLLLALAYVLEVSADEVIVACLRRAAGEQG